MRSPISNKLTVRERGLLDKLCQWVLEHYEGPRTADAGPIELWLYAEDLLWITEKSGRPDRAAQEIRAMLSRASETARLADSVRDRGSRHRWRLTLPKFAEFQGWTGSQTGGRTDREEKRKSSSLSHGVWLSDEDFREIRARWKSSRYAPLLGHLDPYLDAAREHLAANSTKARDVDSIWGLIEHYAERDLQKRTPRADRRSPVARVRPVP